MGSKTLGNMLSSGRFTVVAVEDMRTSLRNRISAPASLGVALADAQAEGTPLSPVQEEAFPSMRTWPPGEGGPRSPRPAQPPPVVPASQPEPAESAAAERPDKGVPDAPADADRRDSGSGPEPLPSAFARASAEALAPATPKEQELPAGAYPQIETNVTRSGRLLADDQLENANTSSTDIMISQMQRDDAAARRHQQQQQQQKVPKTDLNLIATTGASGEAKQQPAAPGPSISSVKAPSAAPLPSPFSVEGGGQLLSCESPAVAAAATPTASEEKHAEAAAEANAAAPLPLSDISPEPVNGMQSISASARNHRCATCPAKASRTLEQCARLLLQTW